LLKRKRGKRLIKGEKQRNSFSF